MLNYKKKKETIKKKTRELSILCDIKACVILVDPDGEVDTWPENPTDFNPIIQSYKENLFHGKRKRIDDEAVERRIEFLKMMNYGNGVVGGSTSSEKESLLANQETHNSDFEVAINGDRFENSSAYNQEKEIAMAAELWVIAGDESAYDHDQEIDFLRGNATLNNLNNV
ncbi:hypothetical protein MTR67_022283 [Solanum verrucosum]|uniref:MADS-box domain-containing protein n=1 Tax=Solanum verrucosum TaxID=315347 RepID=A0AAF0TXP8_SOLVR|nr:hypothetical protein MTR67_022283 [Solanum verrucosum]